MVERVKFKVPVLITDDPTEGQGHNYLGTVTTITEKDLTKFIRTKSYGSHPGYCTYDYQYYDPDKPGFVPGFCAFHDKQYWNSLKSYLIKEELSPNSKSLSSREYSPKDPDYHIFLLND